MIDADLFKEHLQKIIKEVDDGKVKFKNEDQRDGYLLALNAIVLGLIMKGFEDD